jgi:hypothetical protein
MGHIFAKLGHFGEQACGYHAGRKSEHHLSELCWLVVVDQEALDGQ